MNRKSLLRTCAVLFAVAALALPAAAKDDSLALVPANAATVGLVNIAQMRTSSLTSMLFEHTDRMSADGEAAKFLADAGLSPAKDVDVLVVATAPRTALGPEADILVIAEGRFVPERLNAALVARGAVQKNGYLLLPESEGDHKGAVAFPTSSLALAGTESAVVAALAARANGGTGFRVRGSLAMDLGRIDENATAWALIDVARASRLTKGGTVQTGPGQSGDALRTALKSISTMVVWAKDRGDSLELGACGLSSDAETRQLLEDTARGALSALRLAVKDKSPDMVTILRRFEVGQKDGAVVVEGSIPADKLREMMAKKHTKVAQQ